MKKGLHLAVLLGLVCLCVGFMGNETPVSAGPLILSSSANQSFPYQVNLVISKTDAPRFFTADGPCPGMSSCVLTTRALRPLNGYAHRETVTRGGKTWIWDVNIWGAYTFVTSMPLTSISSYMQVGGPCYKKSGLNCNFRAMRFYTNAAGALRQEVFTDIYAGFPQSWIYDKGGSDAVLDARLLCGAQSAGAGTSYQGAYIGAGGTGVTLPTGIGCAAYNQAYTTPGGSKPRP